MDSVLQAEYSAGLRRLLQEKGKVVRIREEERARHPHEPEYWVSTYGWEDHDASAHVHTPTAEELRRWGDEATKYFGSCGLFIPAGAEVEEVAYSEFQGTFVDNETHIGLNAYGGKRGNETEIRCNCSKYRGLTVRWEGSLQAALAETLGFADRIKFRL